MRTAACLTSAALLVFVCLAPPVAAQQAGDFRVGGPLAGIPLPSLGDLEVELYPGAVERFRMNVGGMEFHYAMFDKQTQLKNWIAPHIPGGESVAPEQFPAKRKKIGNPREALGPVPVVRSKVKAPVFTLDLGELGHGLYAVRVIAAAETAKMKSPYVPLYIAMRVNDGPRGEINQYRVCCSATDDFYPVAEMYFHAPERRRYHAEVWIDEGSEVEPLVHNITLDDVLAGTERRAVKTKRTLTSAADFAALHNSIRAYEADQVMKFTPAERAARDEQIWNWLPPVNAQGVTEYQTLFCPNAVPDFGDWELKDRAGFSEFDPRYGFMLRRGPEHGQVLLVNKKENLVYTMDDLRAGKPLPGARPDSGGGIYRPNPADPKKFFACWPIARAVGHRLAHGYGMTQGFGDAGAAKSWAITRNPEFARDAAVNLIRYAYQFPTLDFASSLDSVTAARETHFSARENRAMWDAHYANYGIPLEYYDFLFEYIQGNEELAKSVGRFVPWVKSSQDVVELLDVYLVQITAKRILRYHYYTRKTGIVTPALVLGDRQVVDPWMKWLFSRLLSNGLPVMGIQDTVINGYDRSGMIRTGSTSYAEAASGEAMHVREYARAVNDPAFDLTDPERFPKPLASCYWPLAMRVGGRDFARIGDVAGPDKLPNYLFDGIAEGARRGWLINQDPKFAWILANTVGREKQTDAEWTQIVNAAMSVPRAPWLDNRSRTVDNWIAALESGLDHDDFRFRRAAYLRVGQGVGHDHLDALDLQVVSHGLPMTIDGGQRSGYSKPNDRRYARTHNTVEVDGQGYRGYSWASSLVDSRGAAYLRVDAAPPPGAKSYARQLAIIDIDDSSSQSLKPSEQQIGKTLPTGVTPGSSYVFDVFRVSGGNSHAYCFHGMVDDEFRWNVGAEKQVPLVTPVDDISTDENYLSIFEMSENFAGPAPETLAATWRYSRDPKQTGTEPFMLGGNYEASSPRKYLGLNLFAGPGARAYRGRTVCYREGVPYQFTCTMTRRTGRDLETVFPAVIEPYAGQSAVVSQKRLPIAANETDAQQAVAVELELRDGRVDVCFADGRPDKVRTIGERQFSGEFAYLSRDKAGLRQATLGGGTRLSSPDLEIIAAAGRRSAIVTRVDYRRRTLYLPGDWSTTGGTLEVGMPGHLTALNIVSTKFADGETAITVSDAPDYLRIEATPGGKPNLLRLRVMPVLKNIAGYDRNWIVSNDEATRFHRADHLSPLELQITDGSLSAADLGPSGMIRLWEYGAGDTAGRATGVSLRRIAAGLYECTGDVDASLSFAARSVTAARDRELRQPIGRTTRNNDRSQVAVTASEFAAGPIYIKVE